MKTNPTVTDPAALSPVMTTRATAKGQIVIPVKMRRKYHIKAGTTIRVIDEGDHIVLRPITRELIYSLYGKYKDYDLLEALAEEKKYEREL
ncbi:MAG: AbrB/MazE/SpoVT family DNA-binding domain-containing protein [Candidatus Brocadiales bacterium]|nr:AbrB/MazE/SpoVT family DNA-binding domain-containing protein [Candidatus Bathyanammoxibius sp.]